MHIDDLPLPTAGSLYLFYRGISTFGEWVFGLLSTLGQTACFLYRRRTQA
jgi:hypothetical protein